MICTDGMQSYGAHLGYMREDFDGHEDAKPEEGNAYRLSSLYLDGDALELCKQTMQGIKNRFKLRIRFYDDNPDGPAFLEIKRRVTDVIRKERAMVTRDGVRRLLASGWLDQSCLMGDNGSPKSGVALLNFCNLVRSINARGCIYVSYVREAYVSPNSDQIRVTFDRQLIGSPYEPGSGLSTPTQGISPPVGGTILELKFTDRFPGWMREMAQAFNLQRTSAAKYVMCVEAMGIRPGRMHAVNSGVTP